MKKLVQGLFVLLFFAVSAMAQDRTVTGTVLSSEDGLPLPGVSVAVKGTTVGTQTNVNGKYTIKTSVAKPILVFSFIGTKTQELSVPSSNVLNVKLGADSKSLQEIVVVGYGSTTKESFTGSAVRISNEDLEKKNVSNVGQALAGEVSGLRVVNNSGQPGEAPVIRIRGFGSVNGNRAPLYVVDGVPFSGAINSINNSDIESATVLKDAAATAIYGSRGANGVIIITTKSGKGKSSFIEADVNYGVNTNLLPRYDVVKSPEEFVGLAWEGLRNYGAANGAADPEAYANTNLFTNTGLRSQYNMWNVANGGELIDPVTRKVREGITRKYDPENWEDYAFQSSNRSDFNLKMGGSNDKTNYYTSFGYLKDKGYSINSDFERLTGRLNLDHQVKPWLTTGVNFNYARSERNVGGQSEDSGSVFWFVDNIPAVYPLFSRDAAGNKIEDPYFGGYEYDYGSRRRFGSLTNAIADATYDIKRHKRNEVNGRAYLNFNILKGLTFENSLGLQYYNNIYVDRGNKYYGSAASTGGSLYQKRDELTSYNFLNLLRYKFELNTNHSFEVLAAHEISDYSLNVLEASASQLVDDYVLDFNNATVSNPVSSYTNSYSIESYFGQLNYNYDRKYYLSASIRRDGSSRFLNQKWGTFGSVGAGWIASNEEFLKNQELVKFLKLKASYGVIGDQAGVGYYAGHDLYSVENNNDQPSLVLDSKGNPDLTWETSKMFQTGVELELGKFLTANFDFYIKNTSNLIFNRQIGPSIGYKYIQVNDGNLRNQGFEFDITGHIIKTKDFYLDLGVNGEMFKNKLTKMPIDPSTGKPKVIDVQSQYGWAEGHSIYDYYMRDFAGVDPNDGKTMWKMFYTDNDGNGQFTAGEQISSLSLFENPNNLEIIETTTKTYANATQHFIGKSAIPTVRGAFRLNAGYKNFDLSVQMLYSLGGYAYDGAYASLMNNPVVGGNNWHKDIFARWQNPGDVTDVPRINHAYDTNVSSLSTRFLTKNNYLALNNVRLGYNFDQSLLSKMGIGGLSVWVSGDNLWIHTARKGFNPSTSEAGTSNTYRYSPLSVFSAGLRAKF